MGCSSRLVGRECRMIGSHCGAQDSSDDCQSPVAWPIILRSAGLPATKRDFGGFCSTVKASFATLGLETLA